MWLPALGATWIAGSVAGTIQLLAQSLSEGGLILIGEPHWRRLPETIRQGCQTNTIAVSLVARNSAFLTGLDYDAWI